jgi:hypothetical protein
MKALWLREVQATLASEEFDAWWRALVELEHRQAESRARHEELLSQVNLARYRAEFTQKNAIDTLYLAGELEDSAAQLLAETAEIENKAYEAVANFESQRIAVSDIYSQMGAAEHNLLSTQAAREELGRAAEQAGDAEQRKELARLGKRKEEAAEELERRFREIQAAYERENHRKMRLWEEVEQMWSRSLDINLSVAERRTKGRRARRTAEQLFKEAERQKQLAEGLHREAEDARLLVESLDEGIARDRQTARRLFHCLVGEEFLYWPRRENNKEAYCVPLGDHPEGFNLELKARTIYMVGRQRGVEFIELLHPDDAPPEEEDPRVDDFFRR